MNKSGRRICLLRDPAIFNRSIGARISGEIAKRWGNNGMSATIRCMVSLKGSAGQSLGRVERRGFAPACSKAKPMTTSARAWPAGKIVLKRPHSPVPVSWRATPSSWATPVYTAPRAASCMRPAWPASASRYAIPVRAGGGGRRGRSLLRIYDWRCGVCARTIRVSTFGAGFTGGFAYVLDHRARLRRSLQSRFDRYSSRLARRHGYSCAASARA